jgi:hypothetical protein
VTYQSIPVEEWGERPYLAKTGAVAAAEVEVVSLGAVDVLGDDDSEERAQLRALNNLASHQEYRNGGIVFGFAVDPTGRAYEGRGFAVDDEAQPAAIVYLGDEPSKAAQKTIDVLAAPAAAGATEGDDQAAEASDSVAGGGGSGERP